MKFKIDKSADLYEILWAIKKRADAANKMAAKLAKEWGGKGVVRYSRNLGGRMDGIVFDDKPALWVHVGQKYQGFYMPPRKPAFKGLWKKILALPRVEASEISDALKFQGGVFGTQHGFVWITCPGVQWKKGFILVDIPNKAKKYKPLPGMTEILGSEFIKLSKLK